MFTDREKRRVVFDGICKRHIHWRTDFEWADPVAATQIWHACVGDSVTPDTPECDGISLHNKLFGKTGIQMFIQHGFLQQESILELIRCIVIHCDVDVVVDTVTYLIDVGFVIPTTHRRRNSAPAHTRHPTSGSFTTRTGIPPHK